MGMVVYAPEVVVGAVQDQPSKPIEDPAAFSTRDIEHAVGTRTSRASIRPGKLPLPAAALVRLAITAPTTSPLCPGPSFISPLSPISTGVSKHYDPTACQLDHVIQRRFNSCGHLTCVTANASSMRRQTEVRHKRTAMVGSRHFGAVCNVIEQPWSNGWVEGQINAPQDDQARNVGRADPELPRLACCPSTSCITAHEEDPL